MRYRSMALASLLLLGGCTAVVKQSSFFPASVKPPEGALVPPPGYKVEDMVMALPGLGRVHAVRLSNPQSSATVLYAGGNMSFVAGQSATVAALAEATRANIILYDYPGRGGTDVPATVDALISFGPAFIAQLRAQNWLGSEPLFVYGLSFGGSQAAGIARQAKAAGLILEGSAADIAAIGRNAVPTLMKPFVHVRTDADLARFDYEGYAIESAAPILLISSQDDQVVRPQIMTDFAARLRERGASVTTVSVPGPHGRALREAAAIAAVRRFTAGK
ncbi:alpha/beta fold hydrolase [Sphingomonas arantia]|uniref:Alpha/beta fold hydrolase n=2 Tax=Sphingomonas arantia TaxID=1460676 RepID=A0ABW4TUL1_9SPHN